MEKMYIVHCPEKSPEVQSDESLFAHVSPLVFLFIYVFLMVGKIVTADRKKRNSVFLYCYRGVRNLHKGTYDFPKGSFDYP